MIVKFAQVRNGVVLAVCQTAKTEYEKGLNDPTVDVEYVLLPDEVDDSDVVANWYRKNDQWVIRPTKPTKFHEWNAELESWVPNCELAKAAKKSEIKKELSKRSVNPISVGNILLDASAASQKNLADKLQEVNERIRLGLNMDQSMLVWRDATNAVRCWGDLESYRDWLSVFAIALAERGTRLHQAAWTHKDMIDSLGTVEEIMNYDASIGWPE